MEKCVGHVKLPSLFTLHNNMHGCITQDIRWGEVWRSELYEREEIYNKEQNRNLERMLITTIMISLLLIS